MASDSENGQNASLRQLLEERRARMRRELEAVETLLACLGGGVEEVRREVAADERSAEFSSLKPQDAALRFLQDHPGKTFKPNVVAKKLKRLGVKSESKMFSSVVAAALKRLAERGVLVREMDGGRPVYGWRPAEGAPARTTAQSQEQPAGGVSSSEGGNRQHEEPVQASH